MPADVGTFNGEKMNSKIAIRFLIDIVLVVAAISITIYNVMNGKNHLYMSSFVAVAGTIILLISDIIKTRKGK